MPKKIKLELTVKQLELLLSLCAIADASDTSDGDYTWDDQTEKLFDKTYEELAQAARQAQKRVTRTTD